MIFHESVCNSSADYVALNRKFKRYVVPVESEPLIDASGAAIVDAPVPITWRVLIEGVLIHTVILDFGTTLSSPVSISGAPGVSSVSGSQVIVCGDAMYDPAGSESASLSCDSQSFGHLLITDFTANQEGNANAEATVDIRLQEFLGIGFVKIDQLNDLGQVKRTDYFGFEEQDCRPPGAVSNSVSLPLHRVRAEPSPSGGRPIHAVSVTSGAPTATTEQCFQNRIGDHSLTTTNPLAVPTLEVPRLLASPGCEPGLAIFAPQLRPILESRSTNDIAGSSRPELVFSNPIDVNVYFWIIVNDEDLDPNLQPQDRHLAMSDFIATRRHELEDELNSANAIFEENLVGIRLIGSFPLGAGTSSDLNGASGGCTFGNWHNLPVGYNPKGLNVYYSSAASSESCFTNRKVIYIRATSPSLLAHEVGHAFGLTPEGEGGHVNEFRDTDVDYRHGFGNNNVMWDLPPDSVIRDQLTIGQAFRMHSHRTSVLFELIGGRQMQSQKRTCYPRDRGPRCPPLELNVLKP